VLLYHDADVDPNQGIGDPDPDLRTTVVGFKKGPADVHLIGTPNESAPTGTSFEWSFETARPTVAMLEIGHEPPVTGPSGIPAFDTVITSFTSNGFSTSHDLKTASRAYLPGNPYHALLRVSDQHGNWDAEHRPFTMWKRKIDVVLDQIHIVDDGADGDTTASFKVWVLHGARLKNQFDVPEQTISDSPSPGDVSEEVIRFADISPDVDVTIAPHIVSTSGNNRNDTLGILTRGIAAATFSDHISGDFLPGPPLEPGDPSDLFSGTLDPGTLFDFPIGRDVEVVQALPFSVRALPKGDHEFTYDVTVAISVDYTPS
jgi:hypothetical protein